VTDTIKINAEFDMRLVGITDSVTGGAMFRIDATDDEPLVDEGEGIVVILDKPGAAELGMWLESVAGDSEYIKIVDALVALNKAIGSGRPLPELCAEFTKQVDKLKGCGE